MRAKIAAAAGLLLAAAPGSARAGGITPVQYAYGGGSNAAAVIASQEPEQGNGQSTQRAGTGAGTEGTGSTGHRPGAATAQPLVGITGAHASPAGSFDALHRAIPSDALWAIALAAACALGAWLVRRGSA